MEHLDSDTAFRIWMTELETQTSKNWGSKRWLVRKRTPEGCCCCTICLYTYLLCSAVDKHDFSTLTHLRLESSAICVNLTVFMIIIIIDFPRLNFCCYHLKHRVTGHPVCDPHCLWDEERIEIACLTSDCSRTGSEILPDLITQTDRVNKRWLKKCDLSSVPFVYLCLKSPGRAPNVVLDYISYIRHNNLIPKCLGFIKWQFIQQSN